MRILECVKINKRFQSSNTFFGGGRNVLAVNNISFSIFQSETLGIIGESGSGKSTLAKIVAGLMGYDSGILDFSTEVFRCNSFGDKKLRANIQIVFQSPQASLNPRLRIGDAVSEPLIVNKVCGRKEVKRRVIQMLEDVGLSQSDFWRYPHEFSGGQRQRVCIARALILHPKLLILDEPVSALDLSVQAQILLLLKKLKAKFNMTYMFISHDIRVIEAFCDRVIVMSEGRIVEVGDALSVCSRPAELYTKNLISALLP